MSVNTSVIGKVSEKIFANLEINRNKETEAVKSRASKDDKDKSKNKDIPVHLL